MLYHAFCYLFDSCVVEITEDAQKLMRAISSGKLFCGLSNQNLTLFLEIMGSVLLAKVEQSRITKTLVLRGGCVLNFTC